MKDKKEEKFYYIGEVSKIVELPPHIIRFWEKELFFIKPLRDQKGHRIYTEKDIEKINKIKFWVYNEGYKIKGVKRKLRERTGKEDAVEMKRFLQDILQDIKEIKKCLQ
ncbi:MAG: MerR family transcriptional regulator [Candidatus Omnitrophica bacterium]|nr:MerR family transcriptional regulator [Candidatus Omnitrophota bacterium]